MSIEIHMKRIRGRNFHWQHKDGRLFISCADNLFTDMARLFHLHGQRPFWTFIWFKFDSFLFRRENLKTRPSSDAGEIFIQIFFSTSNWWLRWNAVREIDLSECSYYARVFFFNSLLFSFPRNAKYPDTTLNHLLFPKYLVPPSRFRYVFHWFFSLFRHQCFPLIWVIIIFKNSNFVNLEISERQVIERYQEGTSTFWPEAVERFNLLFWNFVGW